MSARSRAHPWFGTRKPWPGPAAPRERLDVLPLLAPTPPWLDEYLVKLRSSIFERQIMGEWPPKFTRTKTGYVASIDHEPEVAHGMLRHDDK